LLPCTACFAGGANPVVTARDSALEQGFDDGPVAASASLYHLGYSSTLSSPLVASELIGLLQSARKRNQELDVTGLLLHREDSFFQIIEGSRENVLAVFDRICSDQRHERITVLFEGPTVVREFSDWRMGFVELDNVDVRLLPGFSNFLNEGLEARRVLEELTRTRRLMLLFRAMN
jgi:hypothetical protein